MGLPLTVRAHVLESEPAQVVAWQGRALGITTHKRYTFSDQGCDTMVGFRETMSGWPLLLAQPRYSPRALSLQSQTWLEALAAASRIGHIRVG